MNNPELRSRSAAARPPLEADQAHLLHPLHHPSAYATTRVWVSGEGALIRDSNGREYIDGLSGLWNVNVGHGRRELAEAASRQMSTLAFHSSYAGGSNEPAIALAERLSALVYPSINTFFFTSGGAEATETSIKTARFYWKAVGRPDKVKVVSRHRAYHGLTLAAMSATGLPAFWPMFEPRTPGFFHIDAPDPYRFASTGTRRQPRRRGRQPAGTRDPSRRAGHGRGLHRRARPGRRRRDRPAAGLLRPHPRDLHPVRRAADRRRCDYGVRPDRPVVRAGARRRRARHHAVCQGHHERLRAARRHRRVRHDSRGHQRRSGRQALDARLHLLGTPHVLRRGAREHRHPGARSIWSSAPPRRGGGCSTAYGRSRGWRAWGMSVASA